MSYSRNAVGQWERDEALPDGKAMVQLPGLLNVSGHWLLTGDGPMVLPSEDYAVRLEVIGRIVDGEIQPVVLNALRRESPETVANLIQRALGDLGGGGAMQGEGP